MREIQKCIFTRKKIKITQYISEHELWVLGRVSDIYNKTTHKNEEMLEPLWRKYDRSIEGILIFYSKMEASIYSVYLEKKFNEKWSVYALNDFNIGEMVKNNKAIKNSDDYYLLLSAGLWADKQCNITYHGYHLAQVIISVKYTFSSFSENEKFPTLKIPEKVTDRFHQMWKKRFHDFLSHTQSQCNYHNDYLKEQSLIAYNNMQFKESNKIEDCVYMATWKNDCFFCNPESLTLLK